MYFYYGSFRWPIRNQLTRTPILSISFYLASPICFNSFRYGKAQLPKMTVTFVFVAFGVNDLELKETNFWI